MTVRPHPFASPANGAPHRPEFDVESVVETLQHVRAYASETAQMRPRARHASANEYLVRLQHIRSQLQYLRTQIPKAPAEQRERLEAAYARLVSLYEPKFSDGPWKQAFADGVSPGEPSTADVLEPPHDSASSAQQTAQPSFLRSTAAPQHPASIPGGHGKPRAVPNPLLQTRPLPMPQREATASNEVVAQPTYLASVASLSPLGRVEPGIIQFGLQAPEVGAVQEIAEHMLAARQRGPQERGRDASRALTTKIDETLSALATEPQGLRRSTCNSLLAMMACYHGRYTDAGWQSAFSHRSEDIRQLAGQQAEPPVPKFNELLFEMREAECILQLVAFPSREYTEAPPDMIPAVQGATWNLNNIEAFRHEVDKALRLHQERQGSRPNAENSRIFGGHLLAMLKSYEAHLPDPQWQQALTYRLAEMVALARDGSTSGSSR